MILNLFRQVNEHGQTVLLVTHSLRAASYAKRVLFIKDGIVFHEIYRGENEAQGDFMERISQSEFMLSRGKRL
jgi:ABC transporter related